MEKIFSLRSLKNQFGFHPSWSQAVISFLFPIALVLFVRWLVVEPFVIPSGSMIPTLLVNDHVLVLKTEYGIRWPFLNQWLIFFKNPDRGDVIVFRYPKNPEIFFVKRVVGLPGETIRFHAFGSVNKKKEMTLKVPKDHYFVMGDNRSNSSDSRDWGTVPQSLLIGKAWIILYSCEEMLPSSPYLCDPLKIRWERVLKKVNRSVIL